MHFTIACARAPFLCLLAAFEVGSADLVNKMIDQDTKRGEQYLLIMESMMKENNVIYTDLKKKLYRLLF